MKRTKKSLYQYDKIIPTEVPQLIRKTGSCIGYVEFVKRNGEYRKMWFQSVLPHYLLRGGELPYDAASYRISIVRDIMKSHDDCIRAIRWDAVHYLCVKNKRYLIKGKRNE